MKEIVLSQKVLTKKPTGKVSHDIELPARSILKSVTWRIIGTLDTMLISWLITGTLKVAIAIGSIEFVTKIILYFLHERAWNIIKWDIK